MDELSRYLPEDTLGPLVSSSVSPEQLADRAVRRLAPLVLERWGGVEAAGRMRALEPVTDARSAAAAMQAIERLARATGAPPEPVRAASQCAAALVRVGMPGGYEVGVAQLVAAVTRLAVSAARKGLSSADVVQLLVD